MNGGTFEVGERKTRAGIYFRFTTSAEERVSAGSRGIVAIPVVLPWGVEKKVVRATNNKSVKDAFGLSSSNPHMKPFRDAKLNAETVLMYRVNSGEKAKAELGMDIEAVALYSGEHGNDITVSVQSSLEGDSKIEIVTLVEGKEVDRQTVESVADFETNNFIEFKGSGTPEETAGITLEGGSTDDPSNDDYMDFLDAIEHEHFDTIAMPVDDEEVQEAFAAYVKDLRDNQGVKIQGVGIKNSANYEGIIDVNNAPVLPDRTLSLEEIVYFVAGISAGATIRQSNTFRVYPGAIGVEPQFKSDEIEERLGKGQFLFTYDPRDRSVSIEQDINSLVGNSIFRKNKIMRILDGINNDITNDLKSIIKSRKESGEDIPANEDGKQVVLTAITIYMNTLQDSQAIKNFDPQDDIDINIIDGDSFYIDLAVQPVDSAEKFYLDVTVS